MPLEFHHIPDGPLKFSVKVVVIVLYGLEKKVTAIRANMTFPLSVYACVR